MRGRGGDGKNRGDIAEEESQGEEKEREGGWLMKGEEKKDWGRGDWAKAPQRASLGALGCNDVEPEVTSKPAAPYITLPVRQLRPETAMRR